MALKNPTASMPTYELYMQNDVNTKGCTQWYYFGVTAKGRGKVKLRIMNFVTFVLFSTSPPHSIKMEWKFSFLMMEYSGKELEPRLLILKIMKIKIHIHLISFMTFKSLKNKPSLLMATLIHMGNIWPIILTTFLHNQSFKSKYIFI